MRRNRHAFTLVELLVVIAVISVLAALLLPALQAAFDSAWRITCLGERKQNYLHATWYGDDHELRLPPSTKDLAWEGYVEDPRLLFCPAYDRPRRTWRVNAARHLEMMFYDQPGNLATWKKNESVPWPTTSHGYYGQINPRLWKEEIVGGSFDFFTGIKLCGVHFWDADGDGTITNWGAGLADHPDSNYTRNGEIRFADLAEHWGDVGRDDDDRHTTSPFWLACAETKHHMHIGPAHWMDGYGKCHARDQYSQGVNALAYDGSGRWVSLEERSQPDGDLSFRNNDISWPKEPFWKWARKYAEP